MTETSSIQRQAPDFVQLADSPPQKPKRRSLLHQVVYPIATFVADTPAVAAACLVIGVVLSIFASPLAVPFFCLAGGTTVSRLVVKVVDHYNITALRGIKRYACQVQKKYPYLQAVTFLFAVFVSGIPGIAGGIIGGIIGCKVGLFNGLLVEVELGDGV